MLKYFLDTEKIRVKNYKKAILIGSIFIVMTAVLALLIPYGFKRHPELVAFGFISFAITCVVAILIIVISGIITDFRLRKHYPGVWRNSKSVSRKTKAEAVRKIKSINDPYLKKVSINTTRIGMLCLLIWLVVFSVVTYYVLFIGKNIF